MSKRATFCYIVQQRREHLITALMALRLISSRFVKNAECKWHARGQRFDPAILQRFPLHFLFEAWPQEKAPEVNQGLKNG